MNPFKEGDKSDKTFSCPTLVCPSPNDLVEYVRKNRNVSKENCHVRIGLDSGGDFMKITMNVIDKSKHTADNRRCSGDSDTSVDKLFMIGFVKKIPETHYNMKQMLSEIDIASLLVDYTYCGDQKMLNILAGIKNHASKFPCPYCDAKKLFLDNEKAEIRTLHRLTEDLASESKCVVNPCLLVGKPEDSILELFPPPALHFRLRCVNYLCDNLSREWMIVRPELQQTLSSSSQRISILLG